MGGRRGIQTAQKQDGTGEFAGKTAKAVRQDFFAKVFLQTLTGAYAHPVAEKLKQVFKVGKTRKFSQQINRTNAVSATQDIMIAVLIHKQYLKALNAFDKIVFATREIIRHGRSNPRKKKSKKLYSLNYKCL